MPAKRVVKKPEFDPLRNPGVPVEDEKPVATYRGEPLVKKPRVLYANIDGRIVVELTKFGQLMLARCEDDTMYFMQSNGQWAQFIFEVITEGS